MACSMYRLAPKSRLAVYREAHEEGRATGAPVEIPLTLCGWSKAQTYGEIDKQFTKFLSKYPLDLVGRMSTLNSFLFANFPRMNFVGFYTVRVPGETLQVGPYQGEMLACGGIAWGKGVCGTCAAQGSTQIIQDVRKIENYIACDEETLSEIVLPVYATHYHNEAPPTGEGGGGREKKLIAVLDIDGDAVGAFDEEDAKALAQLLEKFIL